MISNNFKTIAATPQTSILAEGNPKQELENVWSLLMLENGVYIYKFNVENGTYNEKPLKAASDLIEICHKKNIKIEPTLLANLYKGPAWFSMFIKFYFAGMEIDNYSDRDLGLDGINQICDEHEIYLYVINHLRSTGGIRNEDNYKKFMNWIVSLDFIDVLKNDSVIESVPGWLKSMMPEMCKLATDADRYNRDGFDPNWTPMCLKVYKNRHIFMKPNIL